MQAAKAFVEEECRWMPVDEALDRFRAELEESELLPARARQELEALPAGTCLEMLESGGDESARLAFERCVLSWPRRCALIIRELLEQEPQCVFLQEVDHYDDLRRGLQDKMQGFHIPNRNSALKFLSMATIWEQQYG